MWNNYPGNNDNYPRSGPPPMGFPSPSGFPGAAPGGTPGYAPSYSSPPPGPPGGFGFPSGPPPPGPPGGSSYPGGPQGFPSPSGPPPSHFPSPAGPPSSYGPPSGPPPPGNSPFGQYGAPPGPPPGGYAPPSGPPPGGYPSPSGPPPMPSRPSGPPSIPPRNSGPPSIPPRMGQDSYAPPSGPPPRPPTQQQNYGPQFEAANHTRQQPWFQYSQCTGKKKALCVGINYFGTNAELKGCINDARNVQRFLCTYFGYKQDDIVMLTDDAKNPRQIPTKQNIIAAMQWLVRDARPNDSLFFHYSGHGGQTKDTDGDEGDGYDETIYPVDFKEAGQLVDDVMHDILVKPLPPGCRLTAIFDSCHSGSALDLPYIYSTEGKVKEPNLAAEAGQGLLSAVSSYARGDMGSVFSSVSGIIKSASGAGSRAEKKARATKTSPADVISWSGCKDSQTSADTVEAGQSTGAMSFAFISVLSQIQQQSYQQLLVNIRSILGQKYSQKPQLSASHPINRRMRAFITGRGSYDYEFEIVKFPSFPVPNEAFTTLTNSGLALSLCIPSTLKALRPRTIFVYPLNTPPTATTSLEGHSGSSDELRYSISMQILPSETNVEGSSSPASSQSSPASLHLDLAVYPHTGDVWLPPPGFREGYSPLYTSPLPQLYELQTSAGYFDGPLSAEPEADDAFAQFDGYEQDEPPRPPTSPQPYPASPGDRTTTGPVCYQYSQCTGRKKALIIGIDYLNHRNALRGAIRDAVRMKAFLCVRFGYREEDVLLMTDEPTNRNRPTRKNIIEAMHQLVEGARMNDSLFFHFSGHGGQVKDKNGDEPDFLDETIYAVDWDMITDDEMHDIMVKDLPRGCRLTAIFDSCHSGSALDLPYTYTPTGDIKRYTLVSGVRSTLRTYTNGSSEVNTYTAITHVGSHLVLGAGRRAHKKAMKKRSEGDVISLSACKDSEEGKDTISGGALSNAFIKALGMYGTLTYIDVFRKIRDEMQKNKFNQKPQFSSSHPMDISLGFIC
ncbi:hypothetical protein BDW22DRAFT_1428962 [Trametopsis cervina]|nr:hypothetical protein BDW22DRAFT_1428962 [Trametopsis cervina]